MMSSEKSIEIAKKMVAEQFGTSRIPFISSTGRSGYIYEKETPRELNGRICEIEGVYDSFGKEKNEIQISCNDSQITLILVKETIYSNRITENNEEIEKGEKLYIMAVKVEGYPIYIPVVILRDYEKNNFCMIKNLYSRVNAIRDFYKLDIGKQKCILKQLQGEHYERFGLEDNSSFQTKQEQMLKYALTKEVYPTDTQRAIEAIFNDSNFLKHKCEQRLAYILNISPIIESRVPITPEEFGRVLDKKFYKMNRPKQLLKDIFAATQRAKKKGCRVLLVGQPGVGKTSLMHAIADAMQLPFECIPLNGISNPLEIEGLDPGYDSADAGTIIRAFVGHRTSQMVIGLDEFDKMNRNSKEGDPMSVFLRTFLGEHYDKFLQCSINTDNTVFVATANSIENIPEAIRNRFNAIIYLEEYSCADKLEIAKQFIIPDVLNNYNISTSDIRFEDYAIEYIITNYCEDDGARDLRHNIEKIINRIISSNMGTLPIVVTSDYAEQILQDLVEETSGLYFRRNQGAYTKPVVKEIKKCLETINKTFSCDTDPFNTEKMRKKLEYLLACRKESISFTDRFNPETLKNELHKNLYGMDKVIKEVTNFYYTEYLQGNRINGNLALYGGFGTGKTTIVKNIASAMGYKYVKVSLCGIEDIKELRGFSSTYIGSEPGRIMKGIKEAGTTRVILQLDELDKLKAEYANAIIDLIDREFIDSFLDIPVDFSQAIFIATANDWGKVPDVLRNRFIAVHVDGYTRNEKSQIITNYIIPKLEKSYVDSKVSILIDDETKKYLLKTYANSFGIRDAEKAIQRICSGKLVDQINEEFPMNINISKSDVRKYLGEEPIPRGNFPDNGAVSGVSKALAVSNDNTGSIFAIETVLLEGDETIEMTGLPKETTIDSVKIAVTCIRKIYPELLKGKHIYVHFGEGSIPKEGPSAGVALFMSILSAALDKPLMSKKPYDIAFTGEISLKGGVFAVGGLLEKIQAASDSGCSKVFIPMQNYDHLDKKRLQEFHCEVIPIGNISQVVEHVYPELKGYKECDNEHCTRGINI